MSEEVLKTSVVGHVKIMDRATSEVLLDAKNAIHPKNMATAIARGLSNTGGGHIYRMKLGNKGTYINTSQEIVFNSPNVSSETANLFSPTYVEVVDDADVAVGIGNSVMFTPIPSSTNTRVIITCVISANEAFDNASDTVDTGEIGGASQTGSTSPYFFDELGLFTKATSGLPTDLNPPNELMLSHIIFSPIEHTGNRELVIIYTLTISVS
jgi:aspartyl aminopeptidase